MKQRLTTFLCTLFTTGALAAQIPADTHVYLLIGQSNMAGRAAYTEAESEALSGCYLLDANDQWEPAKNPLNRHSTIRKDLRMQKLGPGYSFAQAMRATPTQPSIGLVVNAKGGSRIEQWEKGTRFYNEAVRRTQAALKAGGELKGVLWHQGESNSGNADGYLKQLEQLITHLRNDLGMPELPFVAGQVNNVPAINDQIARLPETVPHTAYVSSDGLKTKDRWHFDSDSIKRMGERYAEAMLGLQRRPR